MVQSGKVFCGGYKSKVHSIQALMPGRMTLALPLNPSVPPSTRGITLLWSKLPKNMGIIIFIHQFIIVSFNKEGSNFI